MSIVLFIAIVVLITYSALAFLLVSVYLICLLAKKFDTLDDLIEAALAEDDDDDFDRHYEDNRQIINPIGENPFTS
jgi:hypothetical protein